jgi:Mg/Co/Ni transporter MgtE
VGGVFAELEPEHQIALLESRSDAEAADILAHMPPDDAADLLLELPEERRTRVLGRLPLVQLAKVRALLGYNPETAGGVMIPDFLAVSDAASLSSVLDSVRASDLAPLLTDAVYVVASDGRLVGSVPVVEMLRHDGSQTVGAVLSGRPISVPTHADVPEIAVTMTDYNLSVLPVVDVNQRLVGLVTVDDVLELMLPTDWRTRVRLYESADEGSPSSASKSSAE